MKWTVVKSLRGGRWKIALLLIAFMACVVMVSQRQYDNRSDRIILRVAHLFPDTQSVIALEEIGRAYERLNSGVRVRFNQVPTNVFLQWFRSQMISDTPPDIVQYQLWHLSLRQIVAQRFEPLDELVEAANPYNHGTPLEGVPLRDTYVDQLQGLEAFFPEMGSYFGLPYRSVALRVLYNRDLMREIMGEADWTPSDWRELVYLCDAVDRHASAHGRTLFPMAVGRMGIYIIANEAAIGVSQKLALRTSYDRDVTLMNPHVYSANRYIQGRWSLRDPEITAGLEIYRQLGRFMQPGFLQFSPSEVNFQFLQERALMTPVAIPVLSQEASFSVGAFRMPSVASDDPDYGEYVLGPYSEAEHASTYPFGIPRGARHKEVARDFLRFLTSLPINELFTQLSGMVPVIREVETTPLAEVFRPQLDGYLYGLQPRALGRASTQLIFNNNLHLLFDPKGGVETFIRALERDGFNATVQADTRLVLRDYQRNLRDTDAGFLGLYYASKGEALDKMRIQTQVFRQSMFELDALRVAHALSSALERSE